ncbi:TPA: putative type VI secretion system effector [Pluralibacter gergoviae]
MKLGEKQKCSRFLEPEKLSDLRTKREIELMNGRPWTRELPPSPVLPPYGPLEKISGKLGSFSREYFREYFDVKAYRTSPLPEISDGQRGAAAAAAIAAGSPGIGSAIMVESESSNDSAEYVRGMINGKPFGGWVGVTRLQAGDEVDMIVEWQYDHYEVYAIALPEERIVSICPKCDMGHIAHIFWRIRNMLILIVILMLIYLSVCIYISYSEVNVKGEPFFLRFSSFLMMAFLISSIISGLIAFFACKYYSLTTCKLAEEIYRLLNMKCVSKVNLNKKTKKQKNESSS